MSPESDAVLAPMGDGLYELRFERRYALSVTQVWAALTEPARLADWLAEARLDLRLGGEISLYWPSHDYRMTGVIVALEPPHLIAWTWPQANHPQSVVRWELEAAPGGCRLILTQSHLTQPGLVDTTSGWHTHLEGLADAAIGRPASWSSQREAEHAARYRASLAGEAATVG